MPGWLLYVQAQDYSPVNPVLDLRGRKPGQVVRVLEPVSIHVKRALCPKEHKEQFSLCAIKIA